MDNIRIYFATWNVGTKGPDQDLHKLLSLDRNPEKDKALHDFYVVSFQEVKAQPHNMLVDILFEDPWTNALKDILDKRDYVKIKTIRLQGLVLNIFCLRRHLLNLRDIQTNYTRTGLSGIWGNKGAVSVRLGIYGCSICFVNAHLSAHDENLDDRIDDYNDILNHQEFHVVECTQILFHDYVFWMGDLNFRLSEDFPMTPYEIEQQINKGNLNMLMERDQLREVMRNGKAFSEFTENAPSFPPTFKYEVGTCEYDHKRKPAWTDRVLFKVGTNNYENVTLRAEQLSYQSHPQYSLSDHKPVTSDFNIKVRLYDTQVKPDQQDVASAVQQQVFSDYSERVVEFDRIEMWEMEEDNSVHYKMSQDGRDTSGDWIGLYKDHFSSLDDYVTYVYISKGSSPNPVPRSPHRNMGMSSKSKRYSIQFPEVSNRDPGMYRLLYIGQTSNNVQSVFGMSDSFALVKNSD